MHGQYLVFTKIKNCRVFGTMVHILHLCNCSILAHNQLCLLLQIPLALFCFLLLSIHLIWWCHQLEFSQSEKGYSVTIMLAVLTFGAVSLVIFINTYVV
jgi:hypothetical protein